MGMMVLRGTSIPSSTRRAEMIDLPEVLELCGGDVRCWAEPGEPVLLRAATGADPAEMTSAEARRLASRLLELADWIDRQ
jgi:hypothetical protein